MKKFENPIVEVEKLEVADVITTSPCPEDCLTYDSSNDAGEF